MFLVQFDLIVGFVVHEYIGAVRFIQILHVLSFNNGFGQTFSSVEGPFNHCTSAQVAHFSPYESSAFARFYMLEFNDLPSIAVNFNRYASFKIVRRNHENNLQK